MMRAICVLIAIMIWTTGCNKPDTGPKLKDHELAHKARYHPDIQRTAPTGSSETNKPSTQPFALTRPSDITFGPGPIGCPVLFVNGDPITVQEILEPVIEDLREKAVTLSETEYYNYLLKTIDEVIRNPISTLLVYQEAKTVYTAEQTKEAIDKEAERWHKLEIQRRFGGVQARYETHLKSLGLTPDNIKERARRQIMVMQFQRDRFEPLLSEPNRRERMKYYQVNLDKFTTPAQAELFLIEIPINASSPEQMNQDRKQARSTLEQTLQELQKGTEFTEVTKKYSKGIRAAQGGAWGPISPGSLTGRWAKPAEVLFTLQSGQISDIIETEQSVFIVKCGKKTPEQRLSFEEAQQKIISQLMDEQLARIQNEYFQELLSKAVISKYPDFYRAVIAAAPRPPRYNNVKQ